MPDIYKILKKYWGYDSFRKGQEEIINSVLNGNDTLALLPTGGGKSITYQVPALYKNGICLVISPLIALMKDQVTNLSKNKIKALAIYTGMTYHEIDITLENSIYGDYKFLYVSPERLETDIFKARIKNMNISLIAVDEAHCISQWGYDFRPSYLNIFKLREYFPETPFLALTATATPRVIEDIQDKLGFRNRNTVKTTFERNNLVYSVRNTEDKQAYLINTLKNNRSSGIIYIRNRKNTKEIASFLKKNGINCDYYHAGLKQEIRNRKQEEWTSNKTRIICTTNAFGMGIDKPDVRFVIHYDLPDSLEEYYQEAGRAGRDGKKSFAVLLCNKTDEVKIKQRMAVSFPEITEIKRVYNALCNYYQIPVGAGKDCVYDFQLSHFASVYKINILVIYNSIKILEKEGYIELTDDLNNPSRVIFLVNRDELYKFQIANQQFDNFIKLILRSYTGLFNNYVPIDEISLSDKTGIKKEIIYEYLKTLTSLKIINYIPSKHTPLIYFTEERLDEKSLYISAENYHKRKERYEERIRSVLKYATDTDKCRNVLLLEYFKDDNIKECGKCDNCTREITEGLSNYEFSDLREKVLYNLRQKNFGIEELTSEIEAGNQQKLHKTIRYMLDSGEIEYDKNYYLRFRES